MIDSLPSPSGNRIALHLFPRAERAVRAGHPWVFADSIRDVRRAGLPGDLAVLFDRNNRFLAVGLYDPASPIRVRVLQHRTPAAIDEQWFAACIRQAWERRAPLLETDTTGFRVVHGANDGLPGVVVDRYAGSAVIKLYSAAWIPYLRIVLPLLLDVLSSERIVLRLSRNIQQAASRHALRDGMPLHGPAADGPVTFQENGLTFEADLVQGHKTGFFLDQRDNRGRVEPLSAGKRVLNVFAYTGGFSVYAARGGAREVTSLDISQPALRAAERNLRHNAHIPPVAAADHRVIVGDAFKALDELRREGADFDLVILDPPAFAKARRETGRALASYRKLARLGQGVLRPGGTLVSASCSSRISAAQFRTAVEAAAAAAGRPLEVFEQTGHALDHPVGFPEGEYLKCLYAVVP